MSFNPRLRAFAGVVDIVIVFCTFILGTVSGINLRVVAAQDSVFFLGQRSSSLCAEHDSYVVPIAIPFGTNELTRGTAISANFQIRAVHPQVEIHPLGASWEYWCCCDDENCPSPCPPEATPCVTSSPSSETSAFASSSDPILIFNNGQEQIYVLDEPSDIGTFEVFVNGQSYGQHVAVIFGSRWDSTDSYPQDGVIYSNGFTRWKPKGETSGPESDPCFGTSVVLGPFQLAPPFLSDGYTPNPLRHPKIETIDITVGQGWEARMFGGFLENGTQLMDVEWLIKRLRVDSEEMRVSVFLRVKVLKTFFLYSIHGQYGLGIAEMSSMFADPEKHDCDTQISPDEQIWVGSISNANMGLWGQEEVLHSLGEGQSLCLETTTPTTHNTGSPTLCVIWQGGGLTEDRDPCWCGDKIAFTSNRDGNWEIYVMNDDFTSQTRLTNNAGDDLAPAWSPDCQRIAFISNRDGSYKVYVMNADGTEQHPLTDNLCSCGNCWPTSSQPDWSPDGEWIVFAAQEQDGYCRYNIYRIRPDGTELQRLSSDPWGDSNDIEPTWSPLGDKIAYSTNRTGKYRLAWMDPEIGQGPGGGNSITEDPPCSPGYEFRYGKPSWSPDGQYIAFEDVCSGTIHIIKPDGTEHTTLIQGHNPDWSPDGKYIIYDTGEEIRLTPLPTRAVFRIERDTGNVFTDGAFHGAGFITVSADVAEWVPVSEPVEPGDVLEIDPENPGHYRKARGPCSSLVAGVVSTEPGFVLGHGEDTEGKVLLALMGIVPVKVTDEGGPIQPGDLLVVSSTPGYAMRWDPDSGLCGFVGKALEPWEEGEGVVLVLIMR